MNKVTNILSRILKNKDNRVLFQNFAYLSVLQIASYVLPLLTIPYLASVVGVIGFGKIAFASAVTVWIQTITDWGFNYTATRDLAQCRENKEKVSQIFSNVFWARCFLMIFSFFFLVLLILSIPSFRTDRDILLASFLTIPGHIMFPIWFFQAMEKMKYITILDVLSKVVFTLSVFIFITDSSDYVLQPILLSLGYILSGLVSFFYILKKWKIHFYVCTLSQIFRSIKKSTNIFLNELMPNLYNSFSVVLLGAWCGGTANGILDAGSKLVNVVIQFIQVISRAFFPYLSRNIDNHKYYVKINLSVCVCFSVLLFFLAPFFIDLFFTKEFSDAIIILRIMALSIVFMSMSNVYGINYLIIKGYEREIRNITGIVSIIGFVMAFPLVYYFSYIGAALTISITRILLGLSMFLFAKRIQRTLV